MVMFPKVSLVKVACQNSLLIYFGVVFLIFFPDFGFACGVAIENCEVHEPPDNVRMSVNCAAVPEAGRRKNLGQRSIDFGVLESFLPVDETWQQKHKINFRKICSCYLPRRVPPRLPVGFFGAKTSRAHDALILQGHGKANTTWEAVLGGPTALGHFRLLTADLDGDGRRDAIFSFRSGGTGPPWGGPVISSNRFILLFDDQHMPVPFANRGWFEEGQDEMIDFVSIPGKTGATILDQQPNHEHWSLKLYQAVQGRWQRLSAWPEGSALPILLRRQVPPICADPSDLSNDSPRVIGRLASVSEFNSLSLIAEAVDDKGTFTKIRISEDPQGILVISTRHHRQIFFGNVDPELWKEVLLRMVKMPNMTSISGNLGPPEPYDADSKVPKELYPAIIWVSINP